ncbi:uncharacterized protein C7orf26 homolog [Trichogramma pretiosum]|uniref:uncharacterized protein C7orf26 homolog n=1 Tax=Trichogramma pretiosum TaxID=7493 RepID=UPI0006C9C7F1|nr:uncharacterized protein C7orf26 homolog [Trichogramma pretiosum]
MSVHDLRRQMTLLKFPYDAREALNRLEVLFSKPAKQIDLQEELISHYVFGEIDRLQKSKKPHAMKELQLIDTLCDFFRSPGGNPAMRNAVFLSLFPAHNPRLKTLGLLISYCISMNNDPTLSAAGIWLQQMGPTTLESVRLAEHLYSDFFVCLPNARKVLIDLPVRVPHFTANLLTAFGELYSETKPPLALVKIVGQWIKDNPNILLLPLTETPALPSGCIPMTPVTPIAGLFRWSILHPIRDSDEESDAEEITKCYNAIQQMLMDAVLKLKKINCGNAISAQHLAATIRTANSILQKRPETDESLKQVSLERLGQSISTALSVKCIYGNIQELLALLQPLSHQHFLIEWTLQTYGPETS